MRSPCYISILLLICITCLHCIQLGEGTMPESASYLSEKLEGTMKTIKSEDGDVIECVDFYKQPTLTHPLFKNHTIQMKPSSYLRRLVQENNSSTTTYQNWSKYERCPEGSIPIRRSSTANDPTSSSFRQDLPSGQINANGVPCYLFGDAFSVSSHRFPDIYGTSATLNVWEPYTESKDYSLSRISLIYRQGKYEIEEVKAGWMVNPAKFGDNRARVFVMYTNDRYKTVCYNMDCPGFVQTSKIIVPGAAIWPISTYSGKQYMIPVGLFLDAKTQNVWFHFGTIWVGYWPHSSLPNLSVATNEMSWGGEIFQGASTVQSATKMGSGHWPREGYGKASFVSNIKYVNNLNVTVDPAPNSVSFSFAQPPCYETSNSLSRKPGFGSFFYFGGPGCSFSCGV